LLLAPPPTPYGNTVRIPEVKDFIALLDFSGDDGRLAFKSDP
jgi:hypothetical protein